jgi:P pilus assembly chaperone PapD
MLSTYNISTQNVTTNGLLNFTTDRILTGCTAARSGNTIQLNKPGYYYVSFNAVGSATNTIGELSVDLQNNGVAVSGATASVTTTVAGNNSTLAFSTIIRV